MLGVLRRVRALPPGNSSEKQNGGHGSGTNTTGGQIILRRPLVLSFVVLMARAGMAGGRLGQARRTS
jgi:hypothetical protein